MVGNDIVDIIEAKESSNWERPRFLEKLFTSKEQQYIHNSENPFLMVWRLWSMKEAAYKLYTQINPSRFYNPRGFECDIKGSKGKVRFKDFECYVESRITTEYIISEARLSDCEMTSKVLMFNHRNLKNQGRILKAQLLNLTSNVYNIREDKLSFNKNEFGIPRVSHNSRDINVSLTHHGNYGAIAIS